MTIGDTLSHYRVQSLLGAGGMGEVYNAEDLRLKRAVALKVLPLALLQDPEAKQRLMIEAQAASALEPRFKTAGFWSGALPGVAPLPEMDPINFAPRVRLPCCC